MNYKFKKNIGLNFIFTILSTFTTFILLRSLLKYFNYDQDSYGLWLMVFSVLSYIYLMDFGISNGLRNIITPLVNKNKEKMNIYISCNYLLMILLTVTLAVIINICLLYFPYSLMYKINGFKLDINIFKSFLLLIVNLQIVLFLISSIKPVFHAFSKTYLINLSQFLSNIVTISLIYITISMDMNNSWLLLPIIYLGSQIMVTFVLSIIIIRKYKIAFKLINDKKIYVELLKMGYNFLFLQLSNLILFNTMTFLVGMYVSLEEASRYQISYKLLSVYIMIFSIIMAPIWTLIITKKQENDFKGIKNVIKRLVKMITYLTLPLLVTSLLLNKIIEVWMGKNFDIELLFSIEMCFYILLNMICVVLQGILNGLNIFKMQIVGYLTGAIFLLVSTLTTNMYFKISINMIINFGIISFLIPSIIMCLTLYSYIRKEMENEE
ncbi:oligosaccharide flippase family protein [Staphylococcus equorum]|uniref:oligosaccharide flippase family protein n=2 Tax=Staphylococcus TaxID=1279 RepID=UPI002DB73E5B|nr:oligosaccharide flippase family protein [Staphylococcus equorum]MEB7672505.1 oligosaccharide flippase family protein [Staphylococcus equorum]